MKRILYVLIPITVLGGIIAWRVVQNKRQESAQARAATVRKSAAPMVRVAAAVVRDIVHEFQGVGNVESPSDVQIAAKVTGRVDFLHVREGDPVKRGDVLVRLDPSEIVASIRQQQANNAGAQAALDNAQIKYNRTYDLYKMGFTAAQDVDDARAAVKVARGAVNSGQAQLRNLKAQLSDTILRAPINGFVTARNLDPGTVVGAGQPIVTVQALRRVYITTSVPESVNANIHAGTAASAEFDAYPGQKFEGAVTQVNTAADLQSRQFLVRATFMNLNNQLKPGMFCRISMVTQVTHNAIVVPHEAIHQSPKGPSVIIIDDLMIAHPTLVQTGDQDVTGIAVTSGVKAGDKVVTLSGSPLKGGQKVAIDNSAPPASTAGQPTVAVGGGGASPPGGLSGGGPNAPTYGVPSSGGGSSAGSAAAQSAAGTGGSGSTTSGSTSGAAGSGAGSSAVTGPAPGAATPAIGGQGSARSPAAGTSRSSAGAVTAPSGGSVGAPTGGSVAAPGAGGAGSPAGASGGIGAGGAGAPGGAASGAGAAGGR